MAEYTYRNQKGSPLTYQELDNNFKNVDETKATLDQSVSDAAASALEAFGYAQQTATDASQTFQDTVQTATDRFVASQWASKTDGPVEFGLYSAKAYSVGPSPDGSAKDWATKTDSEVVIGQGFGAKKYAQDAAISASSIDAQVAAAQAAAAIAQQAALFTSSSALDSKAAQTLALPANTSNNGTLGVGATLTANANGALTTATYFDGVTINVGDTVFIRLEPAGRNWLYTFTQQGTASLPWIFTRLAASDTAAEIGNAVTNVLPGGSLYGSTKWRVDQAAEAITVGTTQLTFSSQSAAVAAEDAARKYADNLLKLKLGSNLTEITTGTITSDLAVDAASIGSTRAGGPITPTPNAFTLLTAVTVRMTATAGPAELHIVSPNANGVITTDYIIPFTSPGGLYSLPAGLLANVVMRPLSRLVIKSKNSGVTHLRRGASGTVPGGGTYIITAATSNAVGDTPTVENSAAVGDYNCAMSFTYLAAAEVVESRLDALEAITVLSNTGPTPLPTDELYWRRPGSPTTFYRATLASLTDSMNYSAAGVTTDGRYDAVSPTALLSAINPEYGLKLVMPQTVSWTDTITMSSVENMGTQSGTGTAFYVEGSDQQSADYTAVARFQVTNETTSLQQCVAVGASGTAGDFICYELAIQCSGGAVFLNRRASAASVTIIASAPDTGKFYPANGETVDLSLARYIDASGNVVLTGYVNGVQAVTFTDTSVSKITRAGRGGFGIRGNAVKFQLFRAGSRSAYFGDLTIDTPQKDRCYRRDDGLQTRTVTVSGQAVVGAGAVMCSVMDGRTKAQVVAPFVLDGAPGSTYTGSIPNMPVGWYWLVVWQTGRPRVRRRIRFAVARYVIALMGQSNMENGFGAPSITGFETRSPVRVIKNDANKWYSLWVGPGIARLAKILTTQWPDEPFGFVCYAITGTAISTWLVGGSSWNTFTSTVNGAGQAAVEYEYDVLLEDQGEADALTAEATFLANKRTVYSQFRSVSGRPNLPIFVASSGRNTLGNEYNTVRKVQEQLSQDANCFRGPSRIDIPLDSSGIHHPPSGYQTVFSRWAQAILKLGGKSTYGADGPRVVGATAIEGSTSIDVICVQDGGSDWTATASPFTGFTVYYSGLAQTISNAVAISPTLIRLTVPTVPSLVGSNVTVWIGQGANPDVTNYPKDNTPLMLPLRPPGQAIIVTG